PGRRPAPRIPSSRSTRPSELPTCRGRSLKSSWSSAPPLLEGFPSRASDVLCRDAQMPTEMPLEPTKGRSGHRSPRPGLDVSITDVVGDPIGEDVIDLRVGDTEAVAFEEPTNTASTERVGYRTSCLGFGMAGDQLVQGPESALAVPEQDPEHLPREAVIHHHLHDGPWPGVMPHLRDDARWPGRMMD